MPMSAFIPRAVPQFDGGGGVETDDQLCGRTFKGSRAFHACSSSETMRRCDRRRDRKRATDGTTDGATNEDGPEPLQTERDKNEHYH